MGAMVSRRAVLGGGLAAGAVLMLAGGLRLEAAGPGLKLLSAAEAGVVAAVATVMFPAGAMPLDGVQAGVVAEVDRILAQTLPAIHASGFRYLLRALEWGTFYSRGTRFSQLDTADRAEVLAVWSDPSVMPRRIGSDAMKMIMGMAYFRNATVLEAIGYRSGCAGGVA